MFAVIYQSYIKPDAEIEYQTLWKLIATYFIKHRGALGSCLHKTENGIWVAYSRWPDKATRDASWPEVNTPSLELPASIREAIIKIKACADPHRLLPEICMEVIEDFL